MSEHKSICMKDELKDDKEYSCACNDCDKLAPLKKLAVKDSFALFLADEKAQQSN